MTTGHPRARPGRLWIGAIGVVLAAVGLYRAAPQFGGTGGMDSDEAITQLMANARKLNPFGLYYWGQDRFGSWPFIAEWVIHRLTGLDWSARGLYAVLAGCLLSTAWPLRRVAGWWSGLACTASLLLLLLHDATRGWMLSVGQPYAWQMASFFWAWWLLRRQADEDAQRLVRLRDVRTSRWWTVVAPAAFVSLLCLWTSPLSALFLMAVAMAEAARIPSERRPKMLWLRLCGSVVLAIGWEQIIRLVFQKYAGRKHWRIYWTTVHWDGDYFAQNVDAYWRQVRAAPLWFVAYGSMAVLILWAAARVKRLGASDEVRDALRIAVVCSLLGWLNATFTVLSSWARVNDYAGRYLTPSWVLWVVATAAGLAAIVDWWPTPARRVGRGVLAAGSLAALTAVAMRMPPGLHSALAEARVHAAQELVERQPGGVLFGCYWGVYSLIDGGAPQALTPVIHHRDMQRTPWTVDALPKASTIVVAHEGCAATGTAESPAPMISDSGVLMSLERPRWLEEGPIACSLYANRSAWLVNDAISLDGERKPPRSDGLLYLPNPKAATGREAFTVDVVRPGSKLLVFFGSLDTSTPHPPSLQADWVQPDGKSVALPMTSTAQFLTLPVEAMPRPGKVRFVYAAPPERGLLLQAVAIAP